MSPELLNYVNRSTPRTNIGGKIYTATEYPADKHTPLHNENSYTRSWPNKIMFFCVIAPEVGGETPIADSREVFQTEDKKEVEEYCLNNSINYTWGDGGNIGKLGIWHNALGANGNAET